MRTPTLLFLMSVGLGGCAVLGPTAPQVAPAVDLSAIKVEPIEAKTVAAIKATVKPAPVGATVQQTADWVDRLRADIARKRGAGLELIEQFEQCRAPLTALKAASWRADAEPPKP
jgi:hypothetical protein